MKKQKNSGDISSLGRVILFFREIGEKISEMRLLQRLIERQKKAAGYTDASSPEEAKLSFGFGVARVCAVSVLCLFLAVTLLFGGGIISYENVYYMFKDIGYISSFTESRPDSLNYSRPVNNQDFSSFKNGLAVAGDNEIKFFTSTGRMTLTSGSDFSNPKITCSDSLALIYDQGRHYFAVYNSFISVYSETLRYPISSAHMAKDGSFCVVTRSERYGSVVRVYDKDFSLESEYSKNDLVVSARMSDDGKHVAVLSFDTQAGEGVAKLSVLRRGSDERKGEAVVYDVMPYFVSFLTNDRIVAVCDGKAVVYGLDGDVKGSIDYPGALTFVSETDGGFAMLFDEGSVRAESHLVILDRNGNVRRSEKIAGVVSDMKYHGNYVYMLCENEAVRLDVTLGARSRTPFAEEQATLLVFANGEVMACTDATAYYLSFH